MKSPSCCGSRGKRRTLCHLLLVADMVGVEAFLAVEFIMMVANIQTLGVPVVYSSLPGVISAALSFVLMPVLGLLTDTYAKSKCGKALVLTSVNLVTITGGLLVFFANALQLFYSSQQQPASSLSNVTDTREMESSTLSGIREVFSSGTSNATVLMGTMEQDSLFDYNQTSEPTSSDPSEGDPSSFPVTGILAMVGYGLIDSGYDISNCFMKTFITAVTHPDEHSDIIVKSIFVGSFGGCLITVVGSLGFGKWLTGGTSYDANATECAFLAGVCVVVMLASMTLTLLVGLTYKVEEEDDNQHIVDTLSHDHNIIIEQEERAHLLMDSTRSTDPTRESVDKAWGFSQSSTHTLLVSHRSRRMSGNYDNHNRLLKRPAVQKPQPKKSCCDFLLRNRSRIFLCLGAFFSCGANYSFNLFSVNFVAVDVYKGDPSATVDAPQYANYLQGMQAGSVGFILLYFFFVLAAMSQNYILQRYGWWVETAVLSTLFTGVNLACALTKTEIAYYVTAAVTGCFRAFVFTVPYIVVERIGKDMQMKGQSTNASKSSDIVMIALMWPCAFALCSGIMGPLLEWTGNVATPIFYSVVLSSLGAAMFWLVRHY